MAPLPLGVACVAVRAIHVLFFVSDRLNSEEARAAKIIALWIIQRGAAAAVVGDLELAKILEKVA
jgi:hypothetical protein